MSAAPPGRSLLFAAGAAAFLVVATLNAGGYRYGASDQAFYIPAILAKLDPGLFPRDTALIGPQARYFFVDEIVASLVGLSGWPIEAWFAIGYLLTLIVFYVGLWRLGHHLFRTPQAIWALVFAETLRHRITKTGVNTHEGYFHPRVLVFSVGVWAIAAFLRGRSGLALAIVSIAGLLHPTTAAFFVVFLLPAIWVTEPRARRVVGAAIAIALAGFAWLALAGPLRPALAPMDPEWRALLESKDYLFPLRDWGPGAWIANLGTAALAIGTLARRVVLGHATPRESGLLAGAIVLTLGFLVTLPAVAAGSAFFVQLQISRVFWILDLLGVVALLWLLIDGEIRPAPIAFRRGVVALLVTVSVARGLWVAIVEHGDRPMVSWSLPDNDWSRVLAWATRQPIDVHLVADPGHAWRFGAPLRYAGRDVFLEDVKDSAMAIYSRDSAARVIERRAAIPDFSVLDAESARSLAGRYELDYLITDGPMALPEVHREGAFRVYALH